MCYIVIQIKPQERTMHNPNRLPNHLTLISLLLFTFIVAAELKVTKGNFELHYNTFPSTFLSKEVANTYQITRSKNRGIISLSVLNKTKKPATAVEAKIEIQARNLLNQNKNIKLIKITEESQAVYYLGTFSLNNQEDVNFNISAIPKNSKEVLTVDFSREFYTD